MKSTQPPFFYFFFVMVPLVLCWSSKILKSILLRKRSQSSRVCRRIFLEEKNIEDSAVRGINSTLRYRPNVWTCTKGLSIYDGLLMMSRLHRFGCFFVPPIFESYKWCKVDYYTVRWHESIRTTPRGAQDKQPLALTWCELPWAPADYKTRHNTIKPSVSSAFSKETHRRL